MGFNGTVSGNVHAQPLNIEGGPGGPMVIVVTASNTVYALNATTGTAIWQRNDFGPPVTSGLPCGNISPFGIIGAPVVDLASRSLFFQSDDRWHAQEAFCFLVERGHWGNQSRLAGRPECPGTRV
jgi:outer membrane protein assembly factor BamB